MHDSHYKTFCKRQNYVDSKKKNQGGEGRDE
jgi:hypothetical protein